MLLLLAVALLLLAADDVSAYVYWAYPVPDELARANLDGSGVNESFIMGATNASLLTIDGAHLYWASQNTIGRANLDGTGANENFISGLTSPGGVAVDAKYVYFTNSENSGGSDTVGRANLDGTGVTKNFVPANSPGGVAVDGTYIYWDNNSNTTIGRAKLDGSDVNQSFISGINPNGIAVDGTYIYWADPFKKTIGRAKLDGTGVDQYFIGGLGSPRAVAVDDQHIYWPDPGSLTIGRANLDGGGKNTSFIGPLSESPYGVAVDALPLPPSPTTGTTPTATAGPLPLPSVAIRPSISTLSETHSVFRVGLKSTPLLGRTTRSYPRGTTFSFRLNQPAVVAVRIQRKLPGRRVGRVCKRPTPQNRNRPKCTRLVTKATLRRSARAGLNKVAFSGRIRGRALHSGRYRAAFTAANTAGTSALRALSFRIVAG